MTLETFFKNSTSSPTRPMQWRRCGSWCFVWRQAGELLSKTLPTNPLPNYWMKFSRSETNSFAEGLRKTALKAIRSRQAIPLIFLHLWRVA